MTATERTFLARKARYEQPVQASQGKKGGGILGSLLGLGGLSGLNGAIPVDAPQGPLPSGGNLNQGDPTGGTFSGGPGSPVIALGNPNREQIKIGPFFKPRVDQEAAARLAQDPLAPVQLEKPTTGVGGFFRRMLGDNANERNAERAGIQEQLRLQKWLIDQQSQSKMGLLDKEHQYNMERVRAQIDADNTRQANADQSALQRLRMQDQNALGLEGMRAVNDLIGKTQDQSFRARQSALDRGVTERGQDLTSEAQQLRAVLSQRDASGKVILPEGSVYLNGQAYVPDENGKLQLFTGQLGSGGFDPVAASKRTRELSAAKAEQNEIERLQQPGTAFGGLRAIGSDILDSATAAAGNTMQGKALNQIKTSAVNPLINYLKRIEDEKKAKELMKRGLVNPIPTIE